MEVVDSRYGGEVAADCLTQGACPGAVKDAYARCVEAYGIVNEVCHSLDCLVGPHAAYVYLLFKVELSFVSRVDCRHAETCLFFLLRSGICHGKARGLHGGFEVAECHDCILAVYFEYGAYCALPVEPYVASFGDFAVFWGDYGLFLFALFWCACEY